MVPPNYGIGKTSLTSRNEGIVKCFSDQGLDFALSMCQGIT